MFCKLFYENLIIIPALNKRKTLLNIDEVRKNIILKEGLYYFDYTASGLAYKPIEDEILRFLKTYANTHSDSSSSAVLTQKCYEMQELS